MRGMTDQLPTDVPMHEALRTAIADVREQLGKVEATLRWDGQLMETSAAVIGLAPKLSKLGEEIGRWALVGP